MAYLASFTSHAVIVAFPPEMGEELRELVRRPPALYGLCRSRWRLCDLNEVCAWLGTYTLAGISKALKSLGVHRKRGRLSVHSPDPAYSTKVGWIEQALELARELAREQPEQVRVLYGDEFSLYRQPTLSQTWGVASEEPLAGLSHRSNTRHRVSGALDTCTGQVVWTARFKMGVAGLREFLRTLRQKYPEQTLFLVWDNWPVHQHPEVLTEATSQNIHLLWLPTYAPWLNPIEKLWRWLKQDLLHHHHLADEWEELKRQTAAFLDRFDKGSSDLLRYVGLLAH